LHRRRFSVVFFFSLSGFFFSLYVCSPTDRFSFMFAAVVVIAVGDGGMLFHFFFL